jgi:hypothetical protein
LLLCDVFCSHLRSSREAILPDKAKEIAAKLQQVDFSGRSSIALGAPDQAECSE